MRLEAPMRTGLRFHNDPPAYAPPASEILAGRARTVGIESGHHLFVWHEIEPTPAHPPFPEFVWGPTITVVYENDSGREAAANDLARFVSALVFQYEVFVDPAAPYFLAGSVSRPASAADGSEVARRDPPGRKPAQRLWRASCRTPSRHSARISLTATPPPGGLACACSSSRTAPPRPPSPEDVPLAESADDVRDLGWRELQIVAARLVAEVPPTDAANTHAVPSVITNGDSSHG